MQAAAASLGCPDVDAVAQVAGQAAAVLAEALAPAALRELQELRSLLQVGCQVCRYCCSAILTMCLILYDKNTRFVARALHCVILVPMLLMGLRACQGWHLLRMLHCEQH